MKAYITKYALTSGIEEREGEVSKEFSNAFDAVPLEGKCYSTFWKPHWHSARLEAVIRARDMQAAAIKSAEKKLERLRKMRFE